ncbi:dna2/nam7 helicase family [Holotrichia oblita]|uniref:Dna2/nam7 helicase family n=1 Tax=Holotrichia oblita TaxID=644536 RepID=A0ACB9TW02_HOLOL|nr:dna2/nam7 helicase family [Holotrichia oblita]
MKKFNSKRKVVKNNHKISSFFTKTVNTNNTATANKNISFVDLTDEVIPATPFSNPKIQNNKVLHTITNTDESSKRKRIDSEIEYTLETPKLGENQPKKKHNAESENNIQSTSKFFEHDPSTSNKEQVHRSSTLHTPKKFNISKKTPNKSKSPARLFSKSPIDSFNVEVIQNFVKITPSKSSGKSKMLTPNKSSKKKQHSILEYISPSPSKSEQAQINNESTPDRSPSTPGQVILHSKAKINLNLKFGSTTPAKVDSSVTTDADPKTAIQLPEMLDIDDSWDKFEIEEYFLELSTPQHCAVTSYSKDKNDVLLTVKSTKTNEKAKCKLEGFWIWSKINVGCTIYITGIKDNNSDIWKITNEGGLLVYEPDMLLSNTAVVGALFCKRRSIFKEKFLGFEPENKVMLIGGLIHTLLQGVLKIKTADALKIEDMLHKLLLTRSTVKAMYNCSLSFEDLKTEMMQFVPQIIKFMKDYVLQRPNPTYLKDNWRGTIDSIQDIEENIWCTELGIKGKIDVSISSGKNIMPVELKTGRARVSLEHRGQVMLYILMMTKLGYNVSSGLLLYLREGVLQEIPYNEREKRDLILLRNELAYYLTRKVELNKNVDKVNGNNVLSWNQKINSLKPSELPEPINHSACEKCPYNVICSTFLKYENVDLTSNKVLNSMKEQGLSHLTDAHIQYFIHFCNLLDLESREKTGKHVSEIYTKTPQEREKLGKTITNVKVTKAVTECDGLYEHTFEKLGTESNTTFLTSGVGENSYVIVSTDKRPAIASGLVSFIDHKRISVILERNLNAKYADTTFHIDTYDSNTVFSFNFTSLAILLEATEQADRLRRLIIDKEPATFKRKLPKIIASKAPSILKRLNRAQQQAVLKACSANDYLLIKGMPGAGKTATIVAVVQLLVELGNTILITSHTHAAVDNVCVRLKKYNVNVLRLGSTGRIHSDIQSMSEYELTKRCKTPEELDEIYTKAKVFAVTCFGSKHPIFNKLVVDVCIVDESTQVIQTSLFRALSASKKFILIGDPDQLPPVVKNTDALKLGLSESLFDRLQNPDATATLNLNYRMNSCITQLANSLTYKGELQIANETIANATLKIPNLLNLAKNYKGEKWLLDVLDNSLENSVKILDTGSQSNILENCQDPNINTYEIGIVNYLTTVLLEVLS